VIGGALDWLPAGRPALIGVIHLLPLPGAPGATLPLADILDRARADALAWKEGGADFCLVENYGDSPFFPRSVPPETTAAMAVALRAIAEATGMVIGTNVLRNDGEAALAVAAAAGGRFIRVNVLSHAAVADQGILEGSAHSLLRKRRSLGVEISILADLLVKHASPLAPIDPLLAARDMLGRGGADGLILTGPATGEAVDEAFVRRLAETIPYAPLFVGSGTTPESAGRLRSLVRGFLAATWCFGNDGRVDAGRVGALARAIRGE